MMAPGPSIMDIGTRLCFLIQSCCFVGGVEHVLSVLVLVWGMHPPFWDVCTVPQGSTNLYLGRVGVIELYCNYCRGLSSLSSLSAWTGSPSSWTQCQWWSSFNICRRFGSSSRPIEAGFVRKCT